MARVKGPKVKVSAAVLPARVKGPAAVRPASKARAEAEQIVADIRDRETRVLRNFYQMGRQLSRLQAPALYGSLGYGSFEALLRGEKLMSRSRAAKLIDVAAAYSAKQALALGLERAYGIVEWARNAPTDAQPAKIAASNVKIAGVPARVVPVRALKAETKRLRKKAARRPRGPEPARTRAEEVAAIVTRRLRARGFETPRASAWPEGKKWRVQIIVDADDALDLSD